MELTVNIAIPQLVSNILAFAECLYELPQATYEVAESTATEEGKDFYDGEIQKLYDAVAMMQNKNIKKCASKMVRIHNLPDFAYFNHSQI